MPRPKKKVDLDKLHTLSMIGCSLEVIASQLNVSHDTLQRRYHAEIEAGRASGKKSVLGKAYQLAMRGNGRMLELLLVNWCGFTLRPETTVNVTQNAITQLPLQVPEIKARLAAMHQALRAEMLKENGNGDGLPRRLDGLEG